MKTRYLAALVVFLFSGSAIAEVSMEKKAEIMADVINSLSPKTDGTITVNSAISDGSEVIIKISVENESLSTLTDDDFNKVSPILGKSFSAAICAEDSQKEFIADGGSISYDIFVKDGRELKVTTDECEKIPGKKPAEAEKSVEPEKSDKDALSLSAKESEKKQK